MVRWFGMAVGVGITELEDGARNYPASANMPMSEAVEIVALWRTPWRLSRPRGHGDGQLKIVARIATDPGHPPSVEAAA